MEDYHVHRHVHLGHVVNIGIIDMGGGDNFPGMLNLYITQSESFVFLYDVTDVESVDKVEMLLEQVVCTRQQSITASARPLFTIVGTKADKTGHMTSGRVEQLLNKIYAFQPNHVITTSAKTGANVMECFEELCTSVTARVSPNADIITNFFRQKKSTKNKCLRLLRRLICCCRQQRCE